MIDDPYADLGGRPHAETYAEALARCEVLRPATAKTEQEIAADILASKERLEHHDSAFRDGFVSGHEGMLVSRELAKKMGSLWIEQSDDVPRYGSDD